MCRHPRNVPRYAPSNSFLTRSISSFWRASRRPRSADRKPLTTWPSCWRRLAYESRGPKSKGDDGGSSTFRSDWIARVCHTRSAGRSSPSRRFPKDLYAQDRHVVLWGGHHRATRAAGRRAGSSQSSRVAQRCSGTRSLLLAPDTATAVSLQHQEARRCFPSLRASSCTAFS